MKLTHYSLLVCILLTGLGSPTRSDEPKESVKEETLEASHQVKVKVRMEGPYTADVPLQVVCYFRYTPDRAKRMTGAPVELDKRLGGLVALLWIVPDSRVEWAMDNPGQQKGGANSD